MSKQTFEDFLMEKHAEQYIGTKDCMVDDFNEWVLELGLDIDEVIKYADKFQKQINSELLSVCIKVHDALLSLHVCDQDKSYADVNRAILRQAIAKAEGANQ